jgi:hypothetical protein
MALLVPVVIVLAVLAAAVLGFLVYKSRQDRRCASGPPLVFIPNPSAPAHPSEENPEVCPCHIVLRFSVGWRV